jgi:hypothetical protein
MPRVCRLFACALFVLSGCQRAAVPLSNDAYVWQRQWTPAVVTSVLAARADFAAYRVLAAETDAHSALGDISPDLVTLARTHVAVIAVLRLNGNAPDVDALQLRARIDAIALTWRAAGVQLTGIEIDHDCATARLPAYARLLAALRQQWPRDLRLSITALPTWIGTDALRDVLAQVDASVLQVHAVSTPSSGLFDRRSAQRWIIEYAALSSNPFQVALPAYGVRVSFDASGNAQAVEAEMPRGSSPGARELDARAEEVAALLHELQRDAIAHLTGVVWFRLPNDDDRRAWSLTTLRAVMAAAPLHAAFDVRLDAAGAGARDVVLANRGNLDARAPGSLLVTAGACSDADGANGYTVQRRADGWRFTTSSGAVLHAGAERRIGWLHCGIVENVSTHEHATDQAP